MYFISFLVGLIAIVSGIWYYKSSFDKVKATSAIVLSIQFLARPHISIPDVYSFKPITLPNAWIGSEITKSPEKFTTFLTEEDKKAFTKAILHFQKLNMSLESLSAETDFPLTDDLKQKVLHWKNQLGPKGLGFTLIKGVPTSVWSFSQCEIFFFALGRWLGIPGAQDTNGTLLGHVKSIGYLDNKERPYRQTVDIAYHLDGCDVVGLLCIHPSKEGGISRIISSVSVYNRLLSLPKGQEYARRLTTNIFSSIRPTFMLGLKKLAVTPLKIDKNGVLRVFWNQEYFAKAYRFPNGSLTEDGQLDPLALEAIEAFDKILTDDMKASYIRRGNCTHNDCTSSRSTEELGLDMILEKGDVQLLSNHFNLHARTEFTDYTEEEIEKSPKIQDLEGKLVPSIGKRELFRLWLAHDHRNDLEWPMYLSKQLDLVNVVKNLVTGLLFYR
jgi:hypothetical protein